MQKKQNTFYLVFNNLDAVFQKNGDNKYLTFSSTEKYRIMLENYTEIFDEIAEQIQLITGDEVKYTRDILKIKFKTSSIFLKYNEYHPQISLYGCFYEYTDPLDFFKPVNSSDM